jgi:hypothetical protein
MRQSLGDFVALQVFVRFGEHREQYQAYQAPVELFLEFPFVAIVHRLILYGY